MKATLIKSEDSYILKDGLNHVLGIDDKKLKDRLECPYLLSKQNCDEIFGVVDVEKLAENKYGKGIYEIEQVDAYIEGFNKAMELNDKVFTLEDIVKVVKLTLEDAKESVVWSGEYYQHLAKRLLQSLQQPTEIEVEIEMQCLDPTCDGINRKGICIPGDKPKLDSQGRLILKNI
jgi:hypothetical protein